MAVMAVCGALLLAGLAAGVMWHGRTFCAPAVEGELSAGEAARRFVWYSSLALLAGVGAGISVIGAGGRLAMRLLAVTGGREAQGADHRGRGGRTGAPSVTADSPRARPGR